MADCYEQWAKHRESGGTTRLYSGTATPTVYLRFVRATEGGSG